MHKLLMLGMLLGSANAQNDNAWKDTPGPGTDRPRIRFLTSNGDTTLDFAVAGTSSIETALLLLTTANVVGGSTQNVNCTKWINTGILNSSVVVQTFFGPAASPVALAELEKILTTKDASKGTGYAAGACFFAKFQSGRTLYLPLNTPLAITRDLRIILKLDTAGYVISTLLK